MPGAAVMAQANTRSLASLVMTMRFRVSGAISESTDVVRIIRSHSNAGLLRFRKSEPMVHSGIRRCVSVGVRIRISPRRVAIWNCRSDLVRGRGTPLVAGKFALTISHEFSPLSDAPSSKFLHTAPANAAHPRPTLRSALPRNAR